MPPQLEVPQPREIFGYFFILSDLDVFSSLRLLGFFIYIKY